MICDRKSSHPFFKLLLIFYTTWTILMNSGRDSIVAPLHISM
jgi:hypothetical protein